MINQKINSFSFIAASCVVVCKIFLLPLEKTILAVIKQSFYQEIKTSIVIVAMKIFFHWCKKSALDKYKQLFSDSAKMHKFYETTVFIIWYRCQHMF